MGVDSLTGDEFYNSAFSIYRLISLVGIILLIVDAPHGKFSPGHNLKGKGTSLFKVNLSVNGTISWMVMEIPSPITLLCAYTSLSPLKLLTSFSTIPPLIRLFEQPTTILALLFVLHYLNRAIISPLRTPTRARPHIAVPLIAIAFNLLNGGLIGRFLSSASLSSGVILDTYGGKPLFWFGVMTFFVGMFGNILHDEVLLSIRAKRGNGGSKANGHDGKPHYAIPYGYLYYWISYPNYFCEWVEWTGFAIAASACSDSTWWANPTWWFVINELSIMMPRALSGHTWYHEKFEDYPKNRKAVVPFVI